ncbi:MAG: biliverdin-producing heme oxygenase [Kofleriaceae bacterium]
MYAASQMLTQLNLATRMHHANVDAAQLAILDEPDANHYQAMLVRTYGFEAPVESALAMSPLVEGIDLRERGKAGLLAGDLLTLGLRPQQLAKVPLCPRIDAFETIAEAIGWLYVVERRTLLNAVLVRDLTGHIPEVIERAGSYLHCYAGVAGARWRDLGLAFDRAITPEIMTCAIKAAHHAFWCQRDWFHRESERQAV